MTVTVEGRGRDGSATTGGSSRTGEEASESWLNALTGEGKEAIGGPAGGKKLFQQSVGDGDGETVEI